MEKSKAEIWRNQMRRETKTKFSMKWKIIYQDNDLLVIDKPAGINSDDIPMRIHRLDKDTSGILLTAKNIQALEFFQSQFKERKVEKIYLALVAGNLKNKKGKIETLLGRSPANGLKQKVYLPHEPGNRKKRTATTNYRVLKSFKDYDLIEARPETGRKHQIRIHFAFLGYPIVGDKMYGFKNKFYFKGFKRHFLHASQLEITLPNRERKKFRSELPKELEEIIKHLCPKK